MPGSDVQQVIATIPKIVSIFALAWFSFWPAIPAGLALGLSPLVVILTTTTSYISGVALVVLVGGRAREWIMRRWSKENSTESNSPIQKIWKHYGVVGLGLAAPMTVGAQAGAVVGLAFQGQRRSILVWMAIGALAWSIGLTIAMLLGMIGIQSIS